MWSVIAVIGLEQYPLCYIQMYYWLFAEFWRHEYKWTCYEIWSYLWHNWRKDWESCDLWFWLLTVYIIQYSIQCIWQCVHKGRNSSWNVCSSFTDTYSKFYRLVNIECRILKFIDHYIVLQNPNSQQCIQSQTLSISQRLLFLIYYWHFDCELGCDMTLMIIFRRYVFVQDVDHWIKPNLLSTCLLIQTVLSLCQLKDI